MGTHYSSLLRLSQLTHKQGPSKRKRSIDDVGRSLERADELVLELTGEIGQARRALPKDRRVIVGKSRRISALTASHPPESHVIADSQHQPTISGHDSIHTEWRGY